MTSMVPSLQEREDWGMGAPVGPGKLFSKLARLDTCELDSVCATFNQVDWTRVNVQVETKILVKLLRT